MCSFMWFYFFPITASRLCGTFLFPFFLSPPLSDLVPLCQSCTYLPLAFWCHQCVILYARGVVLYVLASSIYKDVYGEGLQVRLTFFRLQCVVIL